ncbi:MAG: hypothetical protein ABI477_15480 [Chryseolinea sp.]
MKSSLVVIVLFALAHHPTIAQNKAGKLAGFLDQETPTIKPAIFAPGLVSLKDEYEFGSVFSNDGNEFYYAVNVGPIAEIRCIKRKGGKWSKPITVITNDKYSHNDPFLSPDDNKLFFISDRPMDGAGEKKDYDIWYMERTGDRWSSPISAGPSINTNQNEYYVSFSKRGTIYFASNGRSSAVDNNNYEICSAEASGKDFKEAQTLPETINTSSYEADVYVAPDESYLIFCADRPDGIGKGDLYISFKLKDNSWSKSKNMGNVINTSEHELCPFVTNDGKYFFFTSNKDIYWVDAKVIETMR